MSEKRRPILLVGATGLVGGQVAREARAHPDLRLFALSRRIAPLPEGSRIEMLVADPAEWPEAIARLAPRGVICALGTTWRKAGRSEAAFRAVDYDLTVSVALEAKDAGAENFVLISAAGADGEARALYSRVKAEVEQTVSRVGFRRVDILRPGLLLGPRDGDWRWLEQIGARLDPVIGPLLPARFQSFRAIDGRAVAAAALHLVRQDAPGLHEHGNDAILRAAGARP